MKTIGEVSKMTGVSLRTLRHYDAVGLLKPSAVTEAGYRLYDDQALARLQSILLFRELKFSLKEICAILDNPGLNPQMVLTQQIALLEMQRRRLEEIIHLARELMKTGGNVMSFSAFDQKNFDQYAEEVKKKWGDTAAYQEYDRRKRELSPEEQQDAAQGLMGRFAEIGRLSSLPPDSPEVQKAVQALQQFITSHYYTCTLDILAGLGQMYVKDQRFRENIDAAGGQGTADFVSQVIAVYCNSR